MRLITIPFSHYCEKARWALDRYRVDYKEERCLPFFHAAAVKKVSKGKADRAGTAVSTPVLITKNEVVSDSSLIVRYASDHFGHGELYAADGVAEFERQIHDRLAVHTRRWAYGFVLNDGALFRDLMRKNTSTFQGLLMSIASPLAAFVLKKMMKVTASNVERSKTIIDEELARVSELLADKRPFLFGDSFSAADLAFACACAPALVIHRDEGYGAYLPDFNTLDSPHKDNIIRWRATPAGRYVLSLFKNQRRPG